MHEITFFRHLSKIFSHTQVSSHFLIFSPSSSLNHFLVKLFNHSAHHSQISSTNFFSCSSNTKELLRNRLCNHILQFVFLKNIKKSVENFPFLRSSTCKVRKFFLILKYFLLRLIAGEVSDSHWAYNNY